MADLGESLRSAREAKGLTLDEIAQETRISTRFLRAIEQEEFDKLPGGLFNRGFIRTYASKLGLDPDDAVNVYQGAQGDAEGPEPTSPRGETTTEETSGRHVGPIALGALIVLTILVWTSQRGETPEVDAAQSAIEEASTTPNVAPLLASPDPTSNAIRSTATTEPDGSISSSLLAESEQSGLSIVSDAGPRSSGATPKVSVQVEVHEETWVLVEADGRMLTDQNGVILVPGSSQSYTAYESLDLTIGNAAGVTLNVNGREVTNLGRENQVRAFTITPDNADTLPGS